MTLPGPPTQHGIYASPEWTGQPYPSLEWQNIRQDQEPPEGWPRPPKFNEPGDVPGPPVQYGDPITPQTVKAGYGFIDNGIIEKNLYFYHPDHLGSSSYITDREGRITQHTEYIAFGEVLFEEHSYEKSFYSIPDENILLNFKNREEFLAAYKEEFRKTKKELITKKICYSENYDLVANDTDILCSERLKQAIEENGIIGFEFFEIDYEVVAE